jgi:8-oxo-dGTP pyrophosphatase MutT (NUDIX family)
MKIGLYSKNKISRRSTKANFEEIVYQQIGALCYRLTHKKLKILLITSRRSKKWIIPKGWKVDELSSRKSAALEAWEEAGVQGRVSEKPVGTYYYRKKKKSEGFFTCAVNVFTIDVQSSKKVYPEQGQRQKKWIDALEATELIVEPELKNLIRKLSKKIKKVDD